jgi:hypothetical protein
MAPSSSELLAELERRVMEEIRAIDEQIIKSRALRNGPAYDPDADLAAIVAEAQSALAPNLSVRDIGPSSGDAASAASPADEASPASDDAAATNAAAPEEPTGPSPPPTPSPPTTPREDMKAGYLLNFGKKSMFRSFKRQFVVVNAQRVAWYKSEDDFRANPAAPMDSIKLFVLANNSRGSRFKNPAVCLPCLTREACPKATDAKVSYFGVQYIDEAAADSHPVLCFGAAAPAERDEWIFFLTKFVRLYIPLGAEGAEEFARLPLGADPPMHIKEVLDGEGPGSRGGSQQQRGGRK